MMDNLNNHPFKHDPALCEAIKHYCHDAKAWGKAHIAYILEVILSGCDGG
jgi:hypothetical protein